MPGSARGLALVLLLVALAHVPFALLPGPFQDGWLHELLFDRGNSTAVLDRLLANGRPVAAWVNLGAMWLTGSGHGAVWMSVLCLMVAAAGWYGALRATGRLDVRLCVTLSVVAVVSPANQIIVGAPTVIWVFAYAVFSVGLWAFIQARASHGLRAWLWDGVAGSLALLAALVGEATAVMLVLYPLVAVWIGPGAQPLRPAPGRWWWPDHGEWHRSARAAWRLSWPVWIGLAGFAVMFLGFTPADPDFAQERRISLDPLKLGLSALSFGVTLLLVYAPLWLAVLFLRRSAARPALKPSHPPASSDLRLSLLVLGLLAGLVVLGPYVAAMRLASPTGWGGRYLYYIGACLVWWVALWLASDTAEGRVGIAARRMRLVLLAVLLGLMARWLPLAVRTVHEDAVRQALLASSAARTAQILVLDDRTPVWAGPLRNWEWTGLAQTTLARPQAVAAIPAPGQPDNALAQLRLDMRRALGWAPAQVPALDAAYIADNVRGMEVVPAYLALQGSCDVLLLRVDPVPWHWHLAALAWVPRRPFDPTGYRAWLAQSMAGRWHEHAWAGSPMACP